MRRWHSCHGLYLDGLRFAVMLGGLSCLLVV